MLDMTSKKNTGSNTVDITKRASLVALNISQWTARRAAEEITQEVATRHGAKTRMLSNSKYLIDRTALEPITKAVSAARADHYELTLPWLADGYNVLSADLYQDYTARMRNHEAAFTAAVRTLQQQYPDLVNQARRDLGDLFRPSDYPADITAKFAFGTSFLPMPAAGDFRTELNAADVAKIRADIERTMSDYNRQAVRAVAERINDAVGKMAETLRKDRTTKDGGTAPPIFRDTLVSNVRDLVALIPALNITGDPEITKIADLMSAALCVHDPDILRTSEVARDQTATAAEQILEQVNAQLLHVSDYI